MTISSPISMRKFQLATIASYSLLYLYFAPAFKLGVHKGFPLAIALVALLLSFNSLGTARTIIGKTQRVSSADYTDEELRIAIFSTYLMIVSLFMFWASLFNWVLLYTFIGYQVIMGFTYFQIKSGEYKEGKAFISQVEGKNEERSESDSNSSEE